MEGVLIWHRVRKKGQMIRIPEINRNTSEHTCNPPPPHTRTILIFLKNSLYLGSSLTFSTVFDTKIVQSSNNAYNSSFECEAHMHACTYLLYNDISREWQGKGGKFSSKHNIIVLNSIYV